MTNLTNYVLPPDQAQSPSSLAEISCRLESLDAQSIVQWAVLQYGPEVVLASSFGAEDMVLVDMLCMVTKSPRIFYLDTDLLFAETYALIRQVEQHYGFSAIQVRTGLAISEQSKKFGDALWEKDPNLCCHLRKVEPLQRFLSAETAWITGIRRQQTPIRRHSAVVGWDDKFHVVKINPLVNWSSQQVFRYLIHRHIPYNPLHDQGYPSIGCVPCTRPVQEGQNPRQGRWSGQEKTECGIHQ